MKHLDRMLAEALSPTPAPISMPEPEPVAKQESKPTQPAPASKPVTKLFDPQAEIRKATREFLTRLRTKYGPRDVLNGFSKALREERDNGVLKHE